MNEKIRAHKHLKNWSFNSSARQWRFTVRHLKKPVWVNPVYNQKLRDYTLTLEAKHMPGIDFINETLTREKLFDYLENHDIIYDTGIDRWGKTLITFERNDDDKIEKLCKRLFDSVDWSENWCRCDHCGVMVNSMPGYYGDQLDYKILNDCEIICRDCLKDNPEWLIDDYMNSREKAVPSWFKSFAIEAGFNELYPYDFESGFHYGQTDDPKKVAIPKNHDFLFVINAVGQFDIHFNVLVKERC